MILHAEDFGCAADGRWLRQVPIAAGSSVLTVPAGAVLGVDVGASISIPGAADMGATIEKMPDAKKVAGAAIDAGSPLLTVPSQEPFVPDHEGWRIVVDGAGPGGSALLTDIHKINPVTPATNDAQVLVLADNAATTVPNTTAVANDGVRARLSDHARASVGPLRLTVRGRLVEDATMTVGSRILRSIAARFSALDVDEPVTIEGAGHHRTTVQELADDVTVVLADPVQRPVTDGPADVWRPESDCVGRLRDMLLAAAAAGGPVEIAFGAGVYDFTAPRTASGALVVASLNGLNGLTLSGAGRGRTVLRLMPEQDLQSEAPRVRETHMIMARNCHQLNINRLTIHGAYLTMAQGGQEQMHGVFLAEGCTNVDLDGIEVFQTAGDGVRLLGSGTDPVHHVRLDRCHLIQNHRTGVAVQREVVTLRIRRCVIDMTPPGEDACIDLEPTGSAAAAANDVIIARNTLVHGNRAMAVSLSGISPSRPSLGVRFLRNTLTGGRIGGVHTEGLVLLGNTIDAGSAELTGAMIGLRGRCTNPRVEGNQVLAAGQEADGISLDGDVEQAVVIDNDVRTAGRGITLDASRDIVDASRNRVHGENRRPGIRVVTTGGTTHHGIRVQDNVVVDFGRAGIIVGPGSDPDALEGPLVTGNKIDRMGPVPSDLIGIDLTGHDGQWQDAVVEDNEIGVAIPIKIHGPG
jgi:hypothetical protein